MKAGHAARCFSVALMLLATTVAHAANCTISVPNLSFGSYDPISVNAANPLTGATTLTIGCKATLLGTENVTLVIALSSGSGAVSNPYSPRQMLGSSGDHLNYNLYWDAARTQIAGDATGGSTKRSDSVQISCLLGLLLCASATFLETIYGQVFGAQDVGVGSYATVIPVTVTVSF